ncbi:MAG: site-specific integrase [Ruminococcaceae bacterium]|nr:site-specific integrase [Oscillospiraceae bacterium]
MPIYKVDGVKQEGLQKYLVRINFLDNHGAKKQLTRVAFGSDNAKNLERKLLQEVEECVAPSKITLQELYHEHIDALKFEIRESTLEKKKQIFRLHISPILGGIKLDKLNAKILQDWKLQIEAGNYALKTKRNIYAELRAVLNYAVRMEYLPRNPLQKIGNFKSTLELKSEMSYYTAEEFLKFINAALKSAKEVERLRNSYSEWDYYVFFNIAFYCGLRKGEIFALKWSDIDDDDYLHVTRSLNQKLHGDDRETAPKNKSSIRTLQLPKPLVEVLNAHKTRQEQLSGYNDDFRICGGVRAIRDTSVQKKNVEYAKMAGIHVIRIHDFRHSHVSMLANAGVNIQEIARRLGHSDIEMTWNTYSHLYPKEEEKAIEILNKIT